MSIEYSRRFLAQIPRVIRNFPVDLAAVVMFVAIIDLSLFAPAVTRLPVRLVFELLLVLFLPGYAIVAVLFPESENETSAERDDSGTVADRRIGVVHRVGLSFGLSIAIVSLIAFMLNLTPLGIRRVPLIASISGLIVAGSLVAAVRRLQIPEGERFSIDIGRRLEVTSTTLFSQESKLDIGLNALLVVSIVVAVGSVGYVASVPTEGERYTEFYILNEDENEELRAENYPSEFEREEQRPVTLRIRNREFQAMDYTVVVVQQRVRAADGSATVVEERELDRFRANVEGSTWTREYGIEPTMTGERTRVAFLLYRGAPPENPTVDGAYRALRLQVNVSG